MVVGSVRSVFALAGLYLVLSIPAFVLRNRAAVAAVYGDVLVPGELVFAGLAGVSVLILAGLLMVRPGVERYVALLRAPTDVPSAVVGLSLVLAATAWWVVPELAFRLGTNPELGPLLVAIIACQLPMVFLVTILAAVGFAGERTQ